MLTIFLFTLAFAWSAVIGRWVMFAEKPKSAVFHAFSAVVLVLGIGTAAYMAQV